MLVSLVLGSAAIGFAQAIPNLQLKGGVTAIDRVEDVIANWQPTRHVFVKGDIGVGRKQLDELQDWIAKNAPHWTVVLMESASDERYRAADGRDYQGLDAVEHALGNGLSNRTGFGNLEHPKTGESDGAIFVLFLRERKFSYFGSDAQDRRGLGESAWMGQLDQPAFRAMRSGGRIVDAARDTIQSINERLEQAIQAEVDTAARAERERERAAAEVRRGLAATTERVEQVKLEAANFRQANSAATGPLAAPPLAAWLTELDAITAELTPQTARDMDQRLARLNDAVERHLNGYASIQGLDDREQILKHRLASLEQSPGNVAAKNAAATKKLFSQARQSAQAGELGIEETLSQVEASLRAAQSLVDEEAAALRQAELRATWIRRTVLIMLGLIALVIAAVLAFLNRRRRPAMLKAQAELSQREKSVAEQTDGINLLFVRTEDILGNRENLKKRGYEGRTQQLSNQALDYVDDLFIMSREIRRVVSEAKALVYPDDPLGRLTNLFSPTRYQQAINQVSGKPLQFNAIDGLPSVLGGQMSLNNNGSLPDQIALTFEDVFQAFKTRAQEAEHSLDTIETCLSEVNDSLSNLQRDLEQMTVREKELAQAAAKDHYFDLPNFFSELIPAVQKDVATADAQAAFNAVEAMQGAIPDARRKLDQAGALATQISQAREQLFPELTAAANALRQWHYTSTWIDDRLRQITTRCNELMKLAGERSIAPELEEVAASFAQLKSNAHNSVELGKRIEEQLAPELQALQGRVEEGRRSLAQKLHTSIDRVLEEPNRDPDDWLATAQKHLETARSTLSLGRNEVVAAALDAMQSTAARAEGLVQASHAAADAYDEHRQLAQNELERLIQRLPVVARELAPVEENYEPSTLLMSGHLDGDGVKSNPTIPASAVLRAAGEPQSRIDQLLQQAAQAHQQALVLQAEDYLHEAAVTVAMAHQQLDHIEAHLQATADQARQNMSLLKTLSKQCDAVSNFVSDPLVMQPTITAIESVRQSIDTWNRGLAASHPARNPFEVSESLGQLSQKLVQLDAQCNADRQAHAEAARAVTGAQRQLQVAEQLVRQSQTDGIPDSQIIVQANTRIAGLTRSLANIQHDLEAPHGDWKAVDDSASKIQVEMRTACDTLGGELQNASQALSNFQLASQAVYQAEQWSGSFGVRVLGSPGVQELERARMGLQQGNYGTVLELARIAMSVAQGAVAQAEREVTRKRIAIQQAAEAERRAREARRASHNSPFGGGGINIGGGGFGGFGGFGGGGSSGGFGGGGSSGGSFGGGSSSSNSGFGRSGW